MTNPSGDTPTPRPIQPGELLALAAELAGEGMPGRPRTIKLRRAVSTAYYALFHELSFRAVTRLLGSPGWGATESSVARWIAHTDLAELARAAKGSGNAALREAIGIADPRVERIAQDFLDLQDARHSADYDDEFSISRAVAVGWVETAEAAVRNSNTLVADGDLSYQRFLGLAFGAVKVAKKRQAATSGPTRR